MQKTTLAISKDLRDLIKITAVREKMTMEQLIEKLVHKHLGTEQVSR